MLRFRAMSPPLPENPGFVIEQQYGIRVAEDLERHPSWDTTATEEGVSEKGASYTYLEIQYREGDELRATRNVASVLPGNRTELAYWTMDAPEKSLHVHRGSGVLIRTDKSEVSVWEQKLDAEHNEQMLPPGSFYTIKAAANSSEPLVVSGFYEPPPDWDGLEVEFSRDAESVDTPDGALIIPRSFQYVAQTWA